VEEFMLLANRTAAARIAETYPDRALLRRHPPPVQHGRNGLEAAVKLLESMVRLASCCIAACGGLPALQRACVTNCLGL